MNTTTGAAAACWKSKVIPYNPSPGSVPQQIVDFLNGDGCIPNDPSGIVGYVMMNADKTYETYVWCRSDGNEKVRWSPRNYDTTGEWHKVIQDGLSAGSQAFIGVVRGEKGNTVFVVRND